MNLVAKEAPLVNERDGVLDPLGERRRPRGARTLGADREPVRRRRAGGGDPPGADDGRRRTPPASRGDPRARPGARHRGLDRGPARRTSTQPPEGRRQSRKYTSTPVSDEDPRLSHVDEAGGVRMVDVGREACRRAAGRWPTRRRRWRRPPRGGCASCRRATRWRPRSSPASWPRSRPGRSDPALPPAAAVRGRRRRSTSSKRASRSRQRRRRPRPTGVEMEALVAASVAALTVYDMAKAIDKGMVGDRRAAASRRRRSPREGGRADGFGRRPRRHARRHERQAARRAARRRTAGRSSGGSSRTRTRRSPAHCASSRPGRGSS